MPHSKNKGKVGERELANLFNILFETDCRRSQQYCGANHDGDIFGLPIHIECKRTERLQLREALKQALDDTADDIPAAVCHRANRQEWLFSCRLVDLPRIVEALYHVLHSMSATDCGLTQNEQ